MDNITKRVYKEYKKKINLIGAMLECYVYVYEFQCRLRFYVICVLLLSLLMLMSLNIPRFPTLWLNLQLDSRITKRSKTLHFAFSYIYCFSHGIQLLPVYLNLIYLLLWYLKSINLNHYWWLESYEYGFNKKNYDCFGKVSLKRNSKLQP